MPGYGYRGRYGPSTYDDEERRGPFKVIFARAWFLIIPLIGLVVTNVREVTPEIKALNAEIESERLELEATRTKTLTSANPIRSRISALAALSDTYTVRFAKMDTLSASILTFLDGDKRATAKLITQRDSLLRVEATALEAKNAALDTLRSLMPIVDSLEAQIIDRNEEAQRLWAEIVEQSDLADRILRPDAYRKKSALVTGEGEYPRRDELPKR